MLTELAAGRGQFGGEFISYSSPVGPPPPCITTGCGEGLGGAKWLWLYGSCLRDFGVVHCGSSPDAARRENLSNEHK